VHDQRHERRRRAPLTFVRVGLLHVPALRTRHRRWRTGLGRPRPGRHQTRTLTDSDGSFILTRITNGTYSLTAILDGTRFAPVGFSNPPGSSPAGRGSISPSRTPPVNGP
jgi:hypothetical protein